MLKFKLFSLQKELNRLVKKKGTFDTGKILKVSQQLDAIINEYYKCHPVKKTDTQYREKVTVHDEETALEIVAD